jgi:hypothetical protein
MVQVRSGSDIQHMTRHLTSLSFLVLPIAEFVVTIHWPGSQCQAFAYQEFSVSPMAGHFEKAVGDIGIEELVYHHPYLHLDR